MSNYNFRAAPHVIPYQGSKRKLASQILSYFPKEINTLYEPFAGSAAITLAAAVNQRAKKFIIGEKLAPLAELWGHIIESPEECCQRYEYLWTQQLDDPKGYFRLIRDQYNEDHDPIKLLYLVSRCVKNSIRFNAEGKFNQGPDNRRLGTKPEKLRHQIRLASLALKGKTEVRTGDFRKAISTATREDLIYMDPPWQGTSGQRDPRYAHLLVLEELISALEELNQRQIPFLLSFDGTCGEKSYGKELPEFLSLHRVGLAAGRSSQATLLGRNAQTIESLYISPFALPHITDHLTGLKSTNPQSTTLLLRSK